MLVEVRNKLRFIKKRKRTVALIRSPGEETQP